MLNSLRPSQGDAMAVLFVGLTLWAGVYLSRSIIDPSPSFFRAFDEWGLGHTFGALVAALLIAAVLRFVFILKDVNIFQALALGLAFPLIPFVTSNSISAGGIFSVARKFAFILIALSVSVLTYILINHDVGGATLFRTKR